MQKLNVDLIEVEAQLAEMPARQKEARIEAISKAPTAFSGKVGSEALKLERDQQTLEARLQNLIRERDAANEVYAVELRRKQQEDLRPVIDKALALSADEADAWRALGELERERLTLIGKVFDAAEARDQLLLANEAVIASLEDEALKAEATSALEPVVSPFPADSVAVSETLLLAVCDPHRAHRGEGELVHLDGRDFLVSNTPNLSGMLRTSQLSGRVDKRYSSRRAQEFGFGNLLPAAG